MEDGFQIHHPELQGLSYHVKTSHGRGVCNLPDPDPQGLSVPVVPSQGKAGHRLPSLTPQDLAGAAEASCAQVSPTGFPRISS